MIDEALVAREAAALMPNYRRMPVEFVRGDGAHLFDREGREYVDLIAGISQMNVGHCHPAITAAIRDQAGLLVNVSNLFYTEQMIALAEWLRDRSLGGKVFFCNSGTEANEAALKLVRKWAGPDRTEVVALVDGFHGRTYGSLSITGQPSKQEPFGPMVPGARFVERNDLDGLDAAVSSRTAAIFLEVIQGESGVWPLDVVFLERARELADRHGALLVFDEIQTGLSRTGPLFAYQGVDVEPDLMCLAKSLGAGVPIGAIVGRPHISDVFQPGDHGSTFAGGPLACAVAVAAVGVLDDPDLRRHVESAGARLLAGLQALVAEGLGSEARGRGLMCAIDLARPQARDVVDGLLAKGFLVNAVSDRTLRFLPPLVISEGDVDRAVAALAEVVRELG
jgi:acetylornithine/N-succinyldiaminopimelate aminotransferase